MIVIRVSDYTFRIIPLPIITSAILGPENTVYVMASGGDVDHILRALPLIRARLAGIM
jgi:hypothetical protein